MSNVFSLGAWPPPDLRQAVPALRLGHSDAGDCESSYVLALFDEVGTDVSMLKALYVGSSGAGGLRLQQRLMAHARALGFSVPRLDDSSGEANSSQTPAPGAGLASLARDLDVSAPRWKVLATWERVPRGWEDLVAGLLRRAAPHIPVLGGMLPTRGPQPWQLSSARYHDASASGACFWCLERTNPPHRMATCPRRVSGAPAASDLAAEARKERDAERNRADGLKAERDEARKERDAERNRADGLASDLKARARNAAPPSEKRTRHRSLGCLPCESTSRLKSSILHYYAASALYQTAP